MLEKLVQLLRERRLPIDTPIAVQRQARDAAVKKTPLANDVTVTSMTLGGRECERFVPAMASQSQTILYFHGGGYMLGSLTSIRPMASYLASCTGRTVVTLDYRLAPEHPFPAAIEDAVAAYRDLAGLGAAEPSSIVLAGDSAGGGLVLSVLLALRDNHEPLPAAGVCLSPWTDMTLTARSLQANAKKDPQITRGSLSLMAEKYLAGTNPRHPSVSPRFGTFQDLPPILIHVGSAEGLLDDSIVVAERARAAGVAVTLRIWPQMIHVWHAFAPRFPPALDALIQIGVWLDALNEAQQ